MREGDAVTYKGQQAELLGVRMGEIGDVDDEGRGILRPAMVADLRVVRPGGRARRITDVPLADLQVRAPGRVQ